MEAKEEASFCLSLSGDITLPCFVRNLQSGGPPFPGERLALPGAPHSAAPPDWHSRGPWPAPPETGNAERGPWSSRTAFQFSLKLTWPPLRVAP